MKKIALMLALGLVATPVMAKPVHLICGVYTVSLDESAGTLTYDLKVPMKNGFPPTKEVAAFDATTVGAEETSDTAGWLINRITGAFKMTVAGTTFQEGTCKPAKATKTAF